MIAKKGDPTPMIGGCGIPSRRIDSPAPFGCPPDDDLGRQVFWLLSLHPEISLEFRDRDLSGMDDARKQKVLDDIQSILSLRPLNTSAQ